MRHSQKANYITRKKKAQRFISYVRNNVYYMTLSISLQLILSNTSMLINFYFPQITKTSEGQILTEAHLILIFKIERTDVKILGKVFGKWSGLRGGDALK